MTFFQRTLKAAMLAEIVQEKLLLHELGEHFEPAKAKLLLPETIAAHGEYRAPPPPVVAVKEPTALEREWAAYLKNAEAVDGTGM
jgi:hypothetical protein